MTVVVVAVVVVVVAAAEAAATVNGILDANLLTLSVTSSTTHRMIYREGLRRTLDVRRLSNASTGLEFPSLEVATTAF